MTEKVNVLSLDGGGARGYYTISVLAQLEQIKAEQTGNQDIRIAEYFDLLTGTSIGGILALGLASGKSARELKQVFFENAANIFPKKSGFRKGWLTLLKQKYDSAPLAKLVADIVGENAVFNDLQHRVMVPAVNLSTGRALFFKTPHDPTFTRDGTLKLLDAAMATSAAPTYFKPHYCADLETYFADGGLVANNPSFIGFHEVFRNMKHDFPQATGKDVRILNVGTAGEEFCIKPSKVTQGGYMGLWGFGEKLLLTTMAANQQLHTDMLRRELNFHGAVDNFVEIDDSVPHEAADEITLDNASESTLRNLAGRGKQAASVAYSQSSTLQEILEHPVTPYKRPQAS